MNLAKPVPSQIYMKGYLLSHAPCTAMNMITSRPWAVEKHLQYNHFNNFKRDTTCIFVNHCHMKYILCFLLWIRSSTSGYVSTSAKVRANTLPELPVNANSDAWITTFKLLHILTMQCNLIAAEEGLHDQYVLFIYSLIIYYVICSEVHPSPVRSNLDYFQKMHHCFMSKAFQDVQAEWDIPSLSLGRHLSYRAVMGWT